MIIFRWVVTVLFGSLFIWISCLNFKVFWQAYILRRAASSWVPFLGGLSGLVALLAIPIEGMNGWFWLPLLLDWGSLPGTLYSLYFNLFHKSKDKG